MGSGAGLARTSSDNAGRGDDGDDGGGDDDGGGVTIRKSGTGGPMLASGATLTGGTTLGGGSGSRRGAAGAAGAAGTAGGHDPSAPYSRGSLSGLHGCRQHKPSRLSRSGACSS